MITIKGLVCPKCKERLWNIENEFKNTSKRNIHVDKDGEVYVTEKSIIDEKSQTYKCTNKNCKYTSNNIEEFISDVEVDENVFGAGCEVITEDYSAFEICEEYGIVFDSYPIEEADI
jgi:uncharacterized protein YbaR (Trm112 family)